MAAARETLADERAELDHAKEDIKTARTKLEQDTNSLAACKTAQLEKDLKSKYQKLTAKAVAPTVFFCISSLWTCLWVGSITNFNRMFYEGILLPLNTVVLFPYYLLKTDSKISILCAQIVWVTLLTAALYFMDKKTSITVAIKNICYTKKFMYFAAATLIPLCIYPYWIQKFVYILHIDYTVNFARVWAILLFAYFFVVLRKKCKNN